MSLKWERSKRWDDEHIPSWAWPVKAAARALSSITLAVILLVMVALYGVLASVPIGILAFAPTFVFYGFTILATIALVAGIPIALARRGTRKAGRTARFLVLFCGVLVLAPTAVGLWLMYIWPVLRFDSASGEGVRFFATFVERTRSTTVRRLPGMEMSELEFYSWWPLRAVLLLFVVNMITATVRRIEFIFVNLGVLTVHTGIVTIALGSVWYSGQKQEGDTLLLAGTPGADGAPTPGPPQDVFYDNTDVALFVGMGTGWEQRLLHSVPRYNDYNLDVADGDTAIATSGRRLPWQGIHQRPLDIAVPANRNGLVDEDLSFRIVGYCAYSDSDAPLLDWVKADPKSAVFSGSTVLNPLRLVRMLAMLPERGDTKPVPAFAYDLAPLTPASRIADNGTIGLEYTLGMPEQRWSDLGVALPPGTSHGLIVEIPAANFRGVYSVEEGQKITLAQTGFSLEIKQITPTPPFRIITKGYENATSSVAVVRVNPPGGGGFDRWVYHRFPEISQDMLDEVNERGMPRRRDADPMIRLSYVDASHLQVYFDDRPDGSGTRAIVRRPGEPARIDERLGADDVLVDIVPRLDEKSPKIDMQVALRWDHAERYERPNPTPPEHQEKQFVGTHDRGMLAVEVSKKNSAWKRTVWLPYTKYLDIGLNTERVIMLPDGRPLQLAFGRRSRYLPGFAVQLVDFQMIAYDHRGALRDYQSMLRVIPAGAAFAGFEHVTKLNAPLRAPFRWSEERSLPANVVGRIVAGISPLQFKFSQAGWDQNGWQRTQAQVDAGQIPRPYASFTILGVGNNPGIHIIAFGAVLMAVGIPWAFYVKPWLVQRKKKQIQRELAAGTYVRPGKSVAEARA